jgi:hypothetical protein
MKAGTMAAALPSPTARTSPASMTPHQITMKTTT